VRAAPSLEAECVGLRRHGAMLVGRESTEGWLRLSAEEKGGGGGGGGGGWVLIDGKPLGLPHLLEPELPVPPPSASLKQSERCGSGCGDEGCCAANDDDDENGDSAEGDDDDEAEVAAAAAAAATAAGGGVERDSQLLSRGCGAAWGMMTRTASATEGQGHDSDLPTAASGAIHACHCAGGVIFAIDGACALLGQRPHRPPRRRAPRAPAATPPPPRPAATTWPEWLPYMVGPLDPPHLRPSPPAAKAAAADFGGGDGGGGRDRSRAVHRGAAWSSLRGVARRGGAADCSHGFCAVGMPPGCVLAALPSRRFALRSMLGGAAPARLSLPALHAAEARRVERQRRRRVDASREEVLRLIRAELVAQAREDGESSGGAAAAAAERLIRRELEAAARGAPGGGGALDVMGTRRGQCRGCVACPGYALPPLRSQLNSTLIMCCLACGCGADAHEDVGRAAKARADDDDVTRRKMKPPEER